jgi:hypothetical protein
VVDLFGTFLPHLPVADVAYALRIGACAPFVVSTTPVAIFIAHDESHSVRTDLPQRWREYRQLMAAVAADPLIAADLKQQALAAMDAILRPAVRGMGVRAIARGNVAVARLAANLLGIHYNQVGAQTVLYLLAYLCERVPLAQTMFRTVYGAGKTARSYLRTRRLQHAFGSYARFL